MGLRPSLNETSSESQLVDDKIGEAYDTVKAVSEHLDDIATVAANIDAIPDLADILPDLQGYFESAQAAVTDAEAAKDAAVVAQGVATTKATEALASATTASTKATEAAASATAAAGSVTTVAASATAAAGSATTASTAATTAATEADDAAASATAASTSETNAGSSATTATGAATTATTKAAEASASASSVATSETNAATSAAAALVSKNAAAASQAAAAQSAIDAANIAGGGVTSFNSRTGTVVPEADDYVVADITGLQDDLDGLQSDIDAAASDASSAKTKTDWISVTQAVNLDTIESQAAAAIPSSYLDTNTSLSANSDSKIATQKAVKAYVDGIVAAQDAMVFKGVIDCSSNPNYSAGDRGNTWRVSVAGKIGGGSGLNVEIGDFIICLTDSTASGNQATVGSSFAVIQANLDGALLSTAIGVTVAAYHANLTALAAATMTNDNVVQVKSGAFVTRTMAQLKTDLGLATTSVDGLMVSTDKTKLDAVGTMANRAVTISSSAPSGGSDGDVWFQY